MNTVSVRRVLRMLIPNCTQVSEELLKRYRRRDQAKFVSQLIIQDETCIHNFNSESEQQSMQWNKRIGQNCHFITLRNSIFFHVECKQLTTAKMHKIFIAQKSYCARCVLSLTTIKSKYYFNFILNRARSGRELFDRPSYSISADRTYRKHPATTRHNHY